MAHFTSSDQVLARGLGVILDEDPDMDVVDYQRQYELTLAANRALLASLTRATKAARVTYDELDRLRAWRNRLLFALAAVTGFALGEGWMLMSGLLG